MAMGRRPACNLHSAPKLHSEEWPKRNISMTPHQAWPRGGERKAMGQGREEGGGWGSCSEHPARQSPLVSSCLKVETTQAYGITFFWGRRRHQADGKTRMPTGSGAAQAPGQMEGQPCPLLWVGRFQEARETANHYLPLPSPVENEANA